MNRRSIGIMLASVMLCTSSCATRPSPRAALPRGTEAANGGTEVSMVGGGLAVLAFAAVIIGATQVKDKSARAWLWTGIGALVLSGLYIERTDRRGAPEGDQEVALGKNPRLGTDNDRSPAQGIR